MTWCAICVNDGPSLRPCQLTADGPVFLLCRSCDEADAITIRSRPARHVVARRVLKRKSQARYLPLDESEGAMTYRILRAIRRFDWINSVDLSELLEIPSSTTDLHARNTYSVALSRLARNGSLQRRYKPPLTEYRITARGLARIEHTLRSAVEDKRSILS